MLNEIFFNGKCVFCIDICIFVFVFCCMDFIYLYIMYFFLIKILMVLLGNKLNILDLVILFLLWVI